MYHAHRTCADSHTLLVKVVTISFMGHRRGFTFAHAHMATPTIKYCCVNGGGVSILSTVQYT